MPYKPTGKPRGRPRKDGSAPHSNKGPSMSEEKSEAPVSNAIAETPEFKAALNQAVAEMKTSMVREMAAMMAQAGTGAGDGEAGNSPNAMLKVLSDLTTMIRDTANPGGNVKTVAPEEMRKRESAGERLGKLLEEVHRTGQKPHYSVVAQTWLANQLLQPFLPDGEGRWRENEIIWNGKPNTAMRPKNEIAKRIYDLFLASIGGSTLINAAHNQPVWLTSSGLVMVGDNAPQSLATRGQVRQAEPMDLGVGLPTTNELTSTDNPNASRIPVLGTIAPPAERTAAGSVPGLKFPAH